MNTVQVARDRLVGQRQQIENEIAQLNDAKRGLLAERNAIRQAIKRLDDENTGGRMLGHGIGEDLRFAIVSALSSGEVSAVEVESDLMRHWGGWNSSTVCTAMNRMLDAGIIDRRKGRARDGRMRWLWRLADAA